MAAIPIRASAPQGGKDPAEAERAFARRVGGMARTQARALPVPERERRAEEQRREGARRRRQAHSDAGGQGAGGHGGKRVTGERGTEPRRRERGEVAMCGQVTSRRVAEGAEGGRARLLLDEQLHWPPRSSADARQKRVTRPAARGPCAAARATRAEWSGVSRPPRRVAALAVEAAPDGAQCSDHKPPGPDPAPSAVLVGTAEGKGVPLRPEQPQERPRRGQPGPTRGEQKRVPGAAGYPRAPYPRSPQASVREGQREPPAAPAAAPRPRPEPQRVGASLQQDKDTMVDERAAALPKREPGRHKPWAFPCDGAAALQKRARAVLGAVGATRSVRRARFQVRADLGKAA